MKARTKEAFLQSQAHVFYTEPAEPRAGESVRVFYNPNNTVLHGRERVWMRGSFNRWTHRTGCWLPIQMEPAPNGTHLMAEGESRSDRSCGPAVCFAGGYCWGGGLGFRVQTCMTSTSRVGRAKALCISVR